MKSFLNFFGLALMIHMTPFILPYPVAAGPIHVAVSAGNLEQTKRLMSAGAAVNETLKNGFTPLHVAAEKGFKDLASLLIAQGADINAQNNSGETPLHLAAKMGHRDLVGLLILQGANIHLTNNKGETARDYALKEGHMKLATLLGGPDSTRDEIRKLNKNPQEMVGKSMDLAFRAPFGAVQSAPYPSSRYSPEFNTEQYSRIYSNDFSEAFSNPFSTFSIDVDTAAYSNMRRFLDDGRLPPKDAVRIEELINYFSYQYPQPQDEPFSISTELSKAPWNPEHYLVHIGLQGKKIETGKIPPSNLVFLIDVSGSMRSRNKLPLLKNAFRLLVEQLRPADRVAIVVYAGSSGTVLSSTPGDRKHVINEAFERMQASGSTNGEQGIQLAYQIAKQNFIPSGNNRIVLATDGDFNVGVTSHGDLIRLIEEKRKDGIYLSILGFGSGNLKDQTMEQLADKGNGNYSYIDNLLEAKKVLVKQMGGTLFSIANGVKIQVEFNPAKVKSYRLIGYENRVLKKEDFRDDKKDAGELGANHSVTALYEIVPVNGAENFANQDHPKYQQTVINQHALETDEWMTVKIRYKKPGEDQSREIERTVSGKEFVDTDKASDNFQFASAVTEFGMLLRDSEFKGASDYDSVLKRARASRGEDASGYRAEFIRLVETAQILKKIN